MTHPPAQDRRPGASRRALLGVGWSAPVIVAAGTAPAYATSAVASLVFDTFTSYPAAYSGGTPTRIETKVQVRREWSSVTPTVQSLTVTIAFPASVAAGGAAVSVSGAGWAFGSVAGPANGGYTYTMTWTGRLDNSSQSTAELVFQIDRKSKSATSVDLTAVATSPQASTAMRSITTTI